MMDVIGFSAPPSPLDAVLGSFLCQITGLGPCHVGFLVDAMHNNLGPGCEKLKVSWRARFECKCQTALMGRCVS